MRYAEVKYKGDIDSGIEGYKNTDITYTVMDFTNSTLMCQTKKQVHHTN